MPLAEAGRAFSASLQMHAPPRLLSVPEKMIHDPRGMTTPNVHHSAAPFLHRASVESSSQNILLLALIRCGGTRKVWRDEKGCGTTTHLPWVCWDH